MLFFIFFSEISFSVLSSPTPFQSFDVVSLRKMRNYKGKSVGDIFVRTHFLKNLRAFKF